MADGFKEMEMDNDNANANNNGDTVRSRTGFFSDRLARSSTFSLTLERTDTMVKIGKLKLRGKTDDLPQDWWFASTAIPLMAATIGPLANVLSIAALVSKWRVTLPNNGQLPEGTDDNGVDIPDPHWEIIFNAISLAAGFFGNFALLVNFTRRIRYIIALPVTIISWYIATGILIGIVVAMNEHDPPIRPAETYSQGFWYAIIAAVLYLIGSMMLMVNMTGYFLGHYPQHFDLDDDQRTLILQTMMFFFWLAGGAAVFSKVCHWDYADALYFCDVTVLTIGFGDFTSSNDAGRGLVLPYSVIGIIFLGLMINSIRKFAAGMSQEKVIRKHQSTIRAQTFGRSVTSEKELRERLGLPPRRESDSGRRQLDSRRPSGVRNDSTANSLIARRTSLEQYGHFDIHGRTVTFHEKKAHGGGGRGGAGRSHTHKPAGPPLSRDAKMAQRKANRGKDHKRANRREKLILLKEEKDRFDAMREIQANTNKFKQYYALSMSFLAFGILWCVGAAVFMVAERRIQNLSYFEALYFCWVSLLTIGYGDLSPRSNAGKPFFVVWSLVAIPTMTILVSDMGDTVVSAINRGTFTLADWTVMPKEGVWKEFLDRHPTLRDWLKRKTEEREAKKRLEKGFALQDPEVEGGALEAADPSSPLEDPSSLTLETLAEEKPEATEHQLARKLAVYIKRVANDLRADHPKKYSYEEWAEFTRLIRFSKLDPDQVEQEEDEEGIIEWDWIGEDSPLLAEVSESEWVLDRLCESLNRYTRKQALDKKARLQMKKEHPEPDSAIDINTPHSPHYPAHPGHRFVRHGLQQPRDVGDGPAMKIKPKIVLDGHDLSKSESSGGSGSRSTDESGSGSVEDGLKSDKREDDEEDEDRYKEKEEALERQLAAMDSKDWAMEVDQRS